MGLFNLFAGLGLMPICLLTHLGPCANNSTRYFLNLPLVICLFGAWFSLGFLEAFLLCARPYHLKKKDKGLCQMWLFCLLQSLAMLLICLSVMALENAAKYYLVASLICVALSKILTGSVDTGIGSWRRILHRIALPLRVFWQWGWGHGLVLFWVFVYFSVFPSGAVDCGKSSAVKANMHTLQTMIETYSDRHQIFPESLSELRRDALQGNYWKAFSNPFEGSVDIGKALINHPVPFQTSYWDYGGIRFFVHNRYPGRVSYERLSANRYRIYGFNGVSMLLQDKGKPFFLEQELP